MIDFKKAPTKAKKISEAISKKLEAVKESKNDVDLNSVIKTLAKRNVEVNKEDNE